LKTENQKPKTVSFLLLLIILLLTISKNHSIIFAAENKITSPNKPEPTQNPNSKKDRQKSKKPKHEHPAFNQRQSQRTRMVQTQIRRRGVKDPNVLAALNTVPRHPFVRADDLRRAYYDHPLPIGLGQTISQPYIVAYMTEALNLTADSNVLEIGTGSGYQAAVCAEIAGQVYTIEIIKELAQSAKNRLKELGYTNVFARAGDGYYGWKEKGPFDAIIVTAAAGLIPPPLIEQLKPKGIMILPLGSPYSVQTLVLITKDKNGKVRSRSLMPVRFVPMLGRVTQKRP